MKGKKITRVAGLAVVLSLCLLLTGCYTPPDDISDETNNLTIGSSNLPFQTLVPTNTVSVETVPPEQATNQGGNGLITILTPNPTQRVWGTNVPGTNPPAGETGAVTSAEPGASTDPWSTDQMLPSPTPTPYTGGIQVITSAPTNTPALTTKPISQVTPTPTPASIQLGWTGDEVRSLQKRLKELGYYKGSIDGDFGAGTDEAVKAFQKANGLTADGKAGKKTLEKMNSKNAITAAQSKATAKPTTKPANKATAKPTPKVTATPRPTATPNLTKDYYLQLGSSGKKVTQLQNRLIQLGWLGGKATGEFNAATETAVKAFQKKAKIWDDGVAGPDTLKLLYSNSAPRSGSVRASIGETLELGSEGSAVRSLQSQLKKLGYLTGSVDGSFGVTTQAAVIAFQKNNGLTADGKAGSATLDRLFSDNAVKANGTPIDTGKNGNNTDTGEVSSTGYTTLEEGSEGASVRKLQQALKDYGYYTGSVDGSFGSGTTAAVMAFQQKNNLTVDGKAGPATQRALYRTGGNVVTYATLQEGDSGSAVRNLQYSLYELGYYDGSVDGKYGTTTADAVRAFQIRNDLTPVDGKAGNKTLQKIYSSSAIPATAKTNDYESLRRGDKGDDVVVMQDCLEQQGYLDQVTGVFDEKTEAAVKKFQKDHGLKSDGVAGQATLILLYGN